MSVSIEDLLNEKSLLHAKQSTVNYRRLEKCQSHHCANLKKMMNEKNEDGMSFVIDLESFLLKIISLSSYRVTSVLTLVFSSLRFNSRKSKPTAKNAKLNLAANAGKF